MLSALDDAIGNLTQKLKDVGAYDNTIIIFSSDNGADQSGGVKDRNQPLNGELLCFILINVNFYKSFTHYHKHTIYSFFKFYDQDTKIAFLKVVLEFLPSYTHLFWIM